MRRTVASVLVVFALVLVAGCSSSGDGGDDADRPSGTATEGATDDQDASDGTGGDDGDTAVAPVGDPAACPDGEPETWSEAGLHEGLASGDQERSFHLLLPEGEATELRPLFVSITGTVQEEADFMEQSGLDQLPDDGWIVVAPVRNDNGLIWGPWDAMRTPDMTQPNPDSTLILDLVACLSAHQPVDPDRVFVGGISIGGTMVNHLLRQHSDVFAGGIVGSGNFILTEPPEPEPLDPMTVIVAWGGDDDQWTGCPDGRMGAEYAGEPGCTSADFVADAGAAARYYAEEPDVRLLACSEDVGHIWISHATPYWAGILAASPKGTSEPIDVGTPPPPMECSTTPPAT